MHILLLILKIIGGLLLFLLLLLILILFIVLLVPVRYRFSGEKKEEGFPLAQVEVRWLLSLVCFQGAFGPDGLTYQLRLAWKKLLDSKDDQEETKDQEDLELPDDFLEEETASGQSPGPDDRPPEETEPADQTEDDSGQEDISTEDQSGTGEKTSTEDRPGAGEDISTEDQSGGGEETSKEDRPGAGEAISTEDQSGTREETSKEDQSGGGEDISKEDQAPDQDLIDKISAKIHTILDKLEEKKAFLEDKLQFGEELLNTFPLDVYLPILQATLYKLLNHVRPRTIEGHGCYGFEDPYTTGTVTSYTAMLYPFYAGSLDLTPDFTRKILTGDLEGKGRIRLGYLLWILIWLLLKKEVRFVICYVLKLRKKPRQPAGKDRKAQAQE